MIPLFFELRAAKCPFVHRIPISAQCTLQFSCVMWILFS